MVGNGRVDVNDIDVPVLEERRVILVAHVHAKVVAHRVELVLIALADGVAIGVGMFLPKGNELRAKAETDNGDIDFALTHVV
jgi:hypothetical protein